MVGSAVPQQILGQELRPHPWLITTCFRHSSIVAYTMQLLPVVVSNLQVMLPCRYHWYEPAPRNGSPFCGLATMESPPGGAPIELAYAGETEAGAAAIPSLACAPGSIMEGFPERSAMDVLDCGFDCSAAARAGALCGLLFPSAESAEFSCRARAFASPARQPWHV